VNSSSRSLYMLAPVRLSSVCNTRAPYSAGWNFRQYFYAVWYPGHPLTFTENFTEIIPAILDLSKAISRKLCKIGGKLLLISNRKLYMSFRLVPKSVTLNDLERRNGVILRYFTEFGSFRRALRKSWRSLSHLLMSFLLQVASQQCNAMRIRIYMTKTVISE